MDARAWLFALACLLLALGFQVHFSLNSARQYLQFSKPGDLPYLMPVFWIGFNLAMFPGAALAKRYGALPVVAALPALARFEPPFDYPFGAPAGAVALAIAIAAMLPDHDAEHPQRINIVHYQHDDTAEWWLGAGSAPAPEKLRHAASAGAPGPPPFPLHKLTTVATGPAPGNAASRANRAS